MMLSSIWLNCVVFFLSAWFVTSHDGPSADAGRLPSEMEDGSTHVSTRGKCQKGKNLLKGDLKILSTFRHQDKVQN